jgi:transposase InsO family protein
MDTSLIISVLNQELSLYPKPDIVNTDQGSQYTVSAYVDILSKHDLKYQWMEKGEVLIILLLKDYAGV